MFSYTLRQIEFFVAAAEANSVSAAAARHHVSQSGVSLALDQLEKSLGVQLGIRQKAKGFTLTPAGHSFLAEARRLMHQARELEISGKQSGQDLAGEMILGCYSNLSPFILPPLIDGLSATHPQLELSFREGSSDMLQDQMLTGKIDAVFTHRRHLIPGVAVQIIQHRKPYVILSPDHPLARQSTVTLDDLRDIPMVLLDSPSVRDNLLPSIRAAGMDPLVGWGTPNFETVRSLVARGHGYAILMQRPLSDVTYDGLEVACRPIRDRLERSDVCLAYPANVPPSRRLQKLIAYAASLFPLEGHENRPW